MMIDYTQQELTSAAYPFRNSSKKSTILTMTSAPVNAAATSNVFPWKYGTCVRGELEDMKEGVVVSELEQMTES